MYLIQLLLSYILISICHRVDCTSFRNIVIYEHKQIPIVYRSGKWHEFDLTFCSVNMKMRLIFLLSRFDRSITFTEQSFLLFSVCYFPVSESAVRKQVMFQQCIEHLGLGSWTLLFFFINDEQANSYVATSYHLIYQVLFSLFCLLTCTHLQTEIGWRENSRKMLLFSTDAGFHYAGDGKVFIWG